jgi:hypothetical protein
MFILNPIYKYIAIGVAVLGLFGFGYYKGYSAEKERFDAFKAELAAQVKAQELINQSTKKQQDIISKSIRSEYEAKLSALKSYYGGMRQQSSTNSLSTLPSSTIGLDGKTTNLELACSYTTQQLVSLQDWIIEVSKTGQ